ncbi:MAG: hypothetical protein EBU46_17515, partial [Nitrosomonadaceae bacterium]|nr:hypothetical protein [Nitrosomonadaceae bacterium]
SPDGTLGIRVSGDHGGDNTVLLTLQNYQSSLENIVDKFQEQNSDTTIGLVVNRLASLSMDGQNFTLRDIDPVTGADRSIHYDSSGKPTDAIPGSPEYFRSMGEQFIYSALGREAIAPQWEVETARLQTLAGDPQAGLTELQRAERNSKLAPAQDNAATSETWRPILLDLNGDGVQTTNQADANVAFDVDGTGYLKNTDWISQQDGFLVLDRNFNNSIDNGDELFSNSLVANSAKGLASMKWVDANADGDITTSDPVFNQLKVWQDINSNGAVDNGETKTLNALGITALHYGRGSYEKDGQTNQMNSPDLTADTVGAQVHTVKGGIVVQNDNGQVSFIVTNTEDFSGIEDTPVDILANDLLKSTAFTIVGVSDARHGSVSLHNGVVHFVPEENYFGADAGFSYTKQDANGNAAAVQFDMQFEARNDIPVVSDIGNYKTPIYGYRVSSSGSDGGADTLEPFFSPGYGYDKSGSNYEYRNEAIDNIIDPYHGNLKITDPDDTVFSYKMLHNGLHGNAVINSDGSWSFTPTDHVGGHDVFQLEVDDEHGGSAIKSISVPIPDPLPENGSSEGGEGADGSETEAEAEAESAEAEAEAEGAEAEGA